MAFLYLKIHLVHTFYKVVSPRVQTVTKQFPLSQAAPGKKGTKAEARHLCAVIAGLLH